MIIRTVVGLLVLASILPAEPEPKTVAAVKGKLRVKIDLKGTFRPADPAEIKLDCEKYRGPFKVEMITASGSWVNKGDIVARIDRKPYDEALVTETMAMERAEMGMRHHRAKMLMDKERGAESLARAARDYARAAKRLKGFRQFDKGFTEESRRLSAQSREHGMERSKDELTQLEKMYTEDELVDATEEIVLKRQRRGYARALANHDLWKRRRDYNKEWYEAWREEDFVIAAEAKETALRHARAKAKSTEESVQADLKKRKHELEKKREAFEKFKADGDKLVFRAPQAGLFLHGAKGRGVEYKKDGKLTNEAVFARIMKAGALELVGEIKEQDILRVKPGLAAEIKPNAATDQSFVGSFKVGYLPSKSGGFEVVIRAKALPPGIRPGMTAKAEVIITEVRDVVLVPKGAVTTKDGKSTVRVFVNGDVQSRDVVVGETDGKQVEIRDGVKVGERVVTATAAAKANAK